MIPDNGSKRARIGRKRTTPGGAPSIGKKNLRFASAQQPAAAAAGAVSASAGASAHHDGAQDPGPAGAIDDRPRTRSTRASNARRRVSLPPPEPPAPVVTAVDPTEAATCQGTHSDPLGEVGRSGISFTRT